MYKILTLMWTFLLSLIGCSSPAPVITNTSELGAQQSIHQFKMKSLEGNEVNLADYKGKVVVVVNTASKCGLTPQYESLEKVYQQYKDKGLVVLGFPANNFMGQEPGSDSEILSFCSKNYGVSFPMFSKVSVKGDDMCSLYQFLTKKSSNGTIDSEVKWNFQKYILDKNGYLVTYLDPQKKINDTESIAIIEAQLAK
jgi:glutathione peroxidase